MKDWYGITYPLGFLASDGNNLFLCLWKKFMCPRGWHLFDECWSAGEEKDEDEFGLVHYLYCDACALDIVIKSVYRWNDKTDTNDYLGN